MKDYQVFTTIRPDGTTWVEYDIELDCHPIEIKDKELLERLQKSYEKISKMYKQANNSDDE